MPTNWQTFPVEFQGGLISNLGQLQQGTQAVGSATILQNFEPSKEGGYKKILGFSKFIDQEVSGSGNILALAILNADKVITARQNGSNVTQYYLRDGSSWASLGSASSLGGKVRHVVYNFDGNEDCMLVDGVNSPAIFTTDGDTLSFPTLPSDLDGAENVIAFKNTLFLSKGSTVYFSAPFSATDFTPASGGGSIRVGGDITGFAVFRERLIIFSKNEINYLSGNTISDFVVQPITTDIGCISGDTIQEVGGDIMFLGPDGVRLLGSTERIGDFNLDLPSFSIEGDIKDFISGTSQFSSIVVRDKSQYRIFAFNPSSLESTATGYLMTKFSSQGAGSVAWATTKGFKVFISDSRYLDNSELALFGNGSGFIYRFESGSSFDGKAIESIFESPFMPVNDPQIRKTFYKMTLYTDIQGIFEVKVDFDFDLFKVKNYNSQVQSPSVLLASNDSGVFFYGSNNSVYGTATYGSELDQVYNTPVIGSGNNFSFRVQDFTTNPSYKIETAVFEYAVHDRI